MENEVVLKTEGLTKTFGSKIAVDSVNITVNRGDIYGFIGKNGAGKTTAMRMVVGMTPPTSGRLELFGGEPLKSARRKIGSLIEAPGIYAGCSAKENMRRLAILCGGTDREIDEILNLVGLGNVGDKKAGAFSLGMKQRLGIAFALLGNPEFMVLDEPINGLDPEGIKSIRDLVLMLNRERGITFLISSHLLDELSKIVTKYGIINNGRLIEEVTAEELMSRASDGLVVTVDDPEKAKTALLKIVPAENIRADGRAVIVKIGFERSAEVNALLVNSGVGVSRLFPHGNGLEQYFIERMGR